MAVRPAVILLPRLSDGVVTLRAPDSRDLPAIEAAIHDREVVRWFGQPTQSAPEVLIHNRRRTASGSPTFTVCRAAAEEHCVGHVWMNVRNLEPTTGYVGYWLLPDARGTGMMTRAVHLLTAWAARALGLTGIYLVTARENERSRRVAARCGFDEVGPAGDRTIDGRTIHEVLYRMRAVPEVGEAHVDKR